MGVSRRFRGEGRAYRGQALQVLMFNESLTGGGCERNLVELATHFDRRQIDTRVLIYHRDFHYAHRLEAAGIPLDVVEKTGQWDFRFALRLGQYIRRVQPDVIHSFLPTPNFWMKLGRLVGGLPPLVIFFGSIQPSRKEFLLDRVLRDSIAQVIVNSSTAQTEAIEHFGFEPERVHLIYNGVDLDVFSPGAAPKSLRAELDVPQDAFLLTVVARVRHEKNHACLIRALVRLQTAGKLPPHVHGRFVGLRADEALILRLEQMLEAAGIGERFRFVGPRSDIPELLRVSDLMVLPSFFEGCPNAVQEALAVAVPVVATDVSDNANLVQVGQNGHLFANDDDEDLAGALLKVFEASDAERQRMGEAGRAIIEDGYSMAAYCRNTQAVYHRAMEGR